MNLFQRLAVGLKLYRRWSSMGLPGKGRWQLVKDVRHSVRQGSYERWQLFLSEPVRN